MSWTQEQIDNTLRTVVERSVADAGFRALAVQDPKAAIGKVSNTPVPDDIKVRFVESDGYDVTVVLPALAETRAELKDEDLVGVAGGTIGPGSILPTSLCTITNYTPFNPAYTKKPNSPTLCPH